MKQEYIDFLTKKARDGDLQAFNQLKRAGIVIEIDETNLEPIETNLYAHEKSDKQLRQKKKEKLPDYLTLPKF